MAKNTQLTNSAVNTEADALAALMNGGFMDIYDGAQPATGDTAIGAQVLLVTLTFGTPAFAAAVAGVLTANAIGSGVAVATGVAAWARIFQSNHTTKVMDISVGTATANAIVPTTSIAAAITVTCSGFTHTIAKATAGS